MQLHGLRINYMNYGITLKKDELILPGALSGAVVVSAGDTIEADFGALGQLLFILNNILLYPTLT